MDFNFIGTIWSLLPPVVAIALALKTKEVYSSLFIGIVLGAILFCLSMGTGFDGFLSHLLNDTVGEGDDAKSYGLIHCLSDPWNVGILVFLVVLGSIVSLMNKAGGSAAFGRWAAKHIKSKIGAQPHQCVSFPPFRVGRQQYQASCQEERTDSHSSARPYHSTSTPSSPSSSC